MLPLQGKVVSQTKGEMAGPGVYVIVNQVTGQVYVGSTTSFGRRRGEHWHRLRRGKGDNPHLQNAWDKYGEGAFDFVTLLSAAPEKLVQVESLCLDQLRMETSVYNTHDPQTNPMLGKHHTAKTREKCRRAQSRRPPDSPETRLLKSLTHLGKPLSAEHKAKIAAARAGPHPAFRNVRTDESIPAGRNLKAKCRELELDFSSMYKVVRGEKQGYKGWVLDEQPNRNKAC